VLLLSITIFSCSSSDNSSESGTDPISEANLEKILGIWNLNARSINGTQITPQDPCAFLFTVEFTPTVVFIEEISGVGCTDGYGSQENYSINGNTLIVGDTTFEIIFLDEVLLIVEYMEAGDNVIDGYVKI
jgi:hypothetical protein